MRQPTFSRARRVRQQRLLRTGIGVVVLVAVAALLVNLLGGDDTDTVDQPPDTPLVAFRITARGFSDEPRFKGPKKVKPARLAAERARVSEILDDLYQRAFVDPAIFDDASTDPFPDDSIAQYFAEATRPAITEDVDSLTLGTERGLFSRVEPDRTRARVAVYFAGSSKPTFAVASVTFTATGTLDDTSAQPVEISQEAVFHLKRAGNTWLISYYKAKQDQESLEPTPTGSLS